MGVDTVVPTFYIVVGTNTLPKHTPCSNGPNSAVKPSALDVIHNALQLLSGGFLFKCVEGDWYMVGGEKSSLSVCWRWLVYGQRGEKEVQTPVVKTCRHHHGCYTLSENRRKSTIKKHEDIYIGQFICNNIQMYISSFILIL